MDFHEPVDVLTAFERSVLRHARATALIASDSQLSYEQLHQQSSGLAQQIESKFNPGSVIAVELSDTLFDIVALLAILKARCTFLPKAASEPPERAAFMLRNAGAVASIAVAGGRLTIQELDLSAAHDRVGVEADSDPVAYVLYTSGSTGTPKGVAMGRRALSHLIEWQVHDDGEHAALPTSQFALLTFDVSFQEIFSTLSAGGSLIRISAPMRRDPEALLLFLREHQVGRLFLPTAALGVVAQAAVEAPPNTYLRRVYVAGEKLRITPAMSRWFAQMPHCRLLNHYGPTETHVVTSLRLPDDPQTWPPVPTIGTALPLVDVRIVGEDDRTCTPGEIGELWIGGPRVATGYVNLAKETDERFLRTPDGIPWYRTGDMVHAQGDELVYHERKDHQLKIAGHRIEPSEIEAALAACPDILDAVVVGDRDSDDRPRLVAYVVVRNKQDVGGSAEVPRRLIHAPWRDRLAQQLPAPMIPTVWIALPRIPLTPNGKVDRRALQPVASLSLGAPRLLGHFEDLAQQRIASIWSQVLGLTDFSLDDAFFDLGGSSLLALTLARQLADAFTVPVSALAIFEYPTVRSMARFLSGATTASSRQTEEARRPSPRRPQSADEPIAIVGLACRFPGAETPTEFWRNLMGGVESVTRLESSDSEQGRVPAAGLIDDVDRFDARLFGMSAAEAALLDPQHRKFLECVWEGLEDAGLDPKAGGPIGVFAGCGPSSYLLNNIHSQDWRPDRTLLDCASEVMLLMTNDKDFLTSRTSYHLNLSGPSVNLNAACATSLFAAHYAVQSLRSGECDLAIAGAACIPTPQLSGHLYEPSMPFSPDGHCRPFDSEAAGTVFGSGVGVVVLKRLRDAERDRDDIYAVIRGSAVNNDGANKVGMAAPSVSGQADVIEAALRSAGVDAESIDYIEAHGTATAVGDPIEVAALSRAFASSRHGWCGIGSVKSNLGHLGWAAGMAGLMKAVLALRHRQVPRTINFRSPNPLLHLESTPFFVAQSAIDLPPAERPRRIGVSAFGLGGVNAHVILEEAPVSACGDAASVTNKTTHVVPLSADAPDKLAELARRFVRHLDSGAVPVLESIAATTSIGRHHHRGARHAIVAKDAAELREHLSRLVTSSRAAASPTGPVVALFGGHGSEHIGMGRALYERFPVYRSSIDRYDVLVCKETGRTVADLLYSSGRAFAPITDITEAHVALFAVGLALFELWEWLGVRFDILIGHSLGEYVAAAAAGVMSPHEGMAVVIARARLIEKVPANGSMVMVPTDAATVTAVVREGRCEVDIAAANSPENTIISGASDVVDAACSLLQGRGLQTVRLRALRAGHSALMATIQEDIETIFRGIPLRPPQRTLVANVTGAVAGREFSEPAYWRHHIRETVQFDQAVRTAVELGATAFVEIGGHPVLLGFVQESNPGSTFTLVPSLQRRKDDVQVFLSGIAALYATGRQIEWRHLAPPGAARSHLPTYPFARTRHWIEPVLFGPQATRTDSAVAPGSGAAVGVGRMRWQDYAYAPGWQTLGSQAFGPSYGVKWIVFAREAASVGPLANILSAFSVSCTVVTIDGSGDACVDVCDEQAVGAYLSSIEGTLHAVCAVPLEAQDPAATGADWVAALRHPLQAVMALTKGLAARGGNCSSRIWLLTRGASHISEEDGVQLLQTPFAGLVRVLSVEYPELRPSIVDLPAVFDSADMELVAQTLSTDTAETMLAVRSKRVMVQRMQAVSIDAEPVVLRHDATYLLVGGLGGLGIETAKAFAARGATSICLAGRNSPSPERTRSIDLLRGLGCTIDIARLDVSDRTQVDQLLSRLASGKKPLAGIVHLAGVLEDGLLGTQDWGSFERVLVPKVQGAWYLHEVSQALGLDLDFFVVFSSATSVLGNLGQANYAAANAFLDGLAQHRAAKGLAAMSINWGVWAGAGHVAERPELLEDLEKRGMNSIPLHIGIEALAHALALAIERSLAQVGFLPNAWPRFLDRHHLLNVPLFEQLAGRTAGFDKTAPEPPSLRMLLARTAADQRPQLIERHLLERISQLVGPEQKVGAEDNLLELGLDSLSMIQLRNRLRSELSIAIPAQLLRQSPTVREIVACLWHANPELRADELSTDSEADSTKAVTIASHEAGSDICTPISIQQRRWLSLNTGAHYGHRVVPVIFNAPLVTEALLHAIHCVVERHQLLRYVYDAEVPSVWESVRATSAVRDLFVDLSRCDSKTRQTAIVDIVETMRSQVPDPRREPSWQLRCAKLSEDRFALLIGAQHIEFDGSGLSVFVDEIRTVYRSVIDPQQPGELPQVTPYVTYAAEQDVYVRTRIAEDRSYFEGLFAGLSTRSMLPRQPDPLRTVALKSKRYTPEDPLASAADMHEAAANLGISPIAILLATFARLVSDVVHSDCVTVALIRSGRVDQRFSRTIGPFTMPFPVPIYVGERRSISELAGQCDRTIHQITARADYPSTDLINVVPAFDGLPLDTYFTDFGLNFTNYRRVEAVGEPKVEILEVLGQVDDSDFSQCRFNELTRIPGLHLVANLSEDAGLIANYWYHSDRVEEGTVRTWAAEHRKYLHALLDAALKVSSGSEAR